MRGSQGGSSMKKAASVILMVVIILTSTLSYAYESDNGVGAIIADTLIVRPIGIVSIAVGTAVFIVALPFALISGSVGTTADELIVKPAEFTFTRDLGDFDSTKTGYYQDQKTGDPARPGE